MLLLSVADDKELERWRSQYERCRLSPEKARPQPTLAEALAKLPRLMSLLLRTRLKASGWIGPVMLEDADIKEIEAINKVSRMEIMAMLLNVASALAQGTAENEHIGAVAEGLSGNLYVGAPLIWLGSGVKISIHGVQAAVISAWHRGETRLNSIMVETQPCACCRQFLRETWGWNALKVHIVRDGHEPIGRIIAKGGEIKGEPLLQEGLHAEGIKGRLLSEHKRALELAKTTPNELVDLALDAAASAYAPYSSNFVGVALRTKRGTVHQGRYAEAHVALAGVMAVESALIDLVLCGMPFTDIAEILLVETRGSVTQFSPTQKLAMAMGNIPFRFMMAN